MWIWPLGPQRHAGSEFPGQHSGTGNWGMRGMGSGPGVGSESAAGVCPGVNCLAGAGQTLIADGLAGGKGKSWYIGQDLAPPGTPS